jgi:chromosome segregation ATPase
MPILDRASYKKNIVLPKLSPDSTLYRKVGYSFFSSNAFGFLRPRAVSSRLKFYCFLCVKILRVNTSRLWHIFETATGATITQELIYEDFQKLLNLAQIEKDEQTTSLILLEKEHGDLLIKMKEIQISLEQFRTTILHITQNTNEIKFKIQNQQQINDRNQEQSARRINHLIFNIKDVQTLLSDYKSLINEIHYLLKLIFHLQTQIEIHHKSILIYQTKLEKYKQDLTLAIINRSNHENQILNLQKRIYQQNQNSQQLQNQQIQIKKNRQQLHQRIHILEAEKNQILNNQQQLLNTIKQTTMKNNLLEKEVLHSKHAVKDLQYSYRQLIKDHNKQQDITKNLHKTS